MELDKDPLFFTDLTWANQGGAYRSHRARLIFAPGDIWRSGTKAPLQPQSDSCTWKLIELHSTTTASLNTQETRRKGP